MVRIVALAVMTGLVSAALAANPPFAGKWRIETIKGADAFDPSKTMFEVASDGQVSSTIGCNRMVGKATSEAEHLRFGPMASTRMACLPPLDQLETKYLAALDTVRAWRIDGTTLSLLDENGHATITLERSQ